MRTLRVGLNLVPIGNRAGGIGSYAAELTGALAARDDVELNLFISRDTPGTIVPGSGVRACTELPVTLSGPPLHLAAQFAAIPALALRRRLDVVHSPANAGPVRIPGIASVVTLHDTIWARAPAQWGGPSAVRSMYRLALPTARRADRIIAVSRHAADDLRALFGLAADRIDVIHHGVRVDPSTPATDERELRTRLGLEDAPVVLCVAQKRPYKNQEALVRALADERLVMARLVLPGAPTPYEARLRNLAEELGVTNRLHMPDWLPASDLEGLYRLAVCCAIPSRLEGFGLPVLEAMARAVPVACSDRTALPEVAGDAALFFNPDEPAAVADALARLLGDPVLRRELSARGLERATRFTWAAAAEATVASYRSALRQRSAGPASL